MKLNRKTFGWVLILFLAGLATLAAGLYRAHAAEVLTPAVTMMSASLMLGAPVRVFSRPMLLAYMASLGAISMLEGLFGFLNPGALTGPAGWLTLLPFAILVMGFAALGGVRYSRAMRAQAGGE